MVSLRFSQAKFQQKFERLSECHWFLILPPSRFFKFMEFDNWFCPRAPHLCAYKTNVEFLSCIQLITLENLSPVIFINIILNSNISPGRVPGCNLKVGCSNFVKRYSRKYLPLPSFAPEIFFWSCGMRSPHQGSSLFGTALWLNLWAVAHLLLLKINEDTKKANNVTSFIECKIEMEEMRKQLPENTGLE